MSLCRSGKVLNADSDYPDVAKREKSRFPGMLPRFVPIHCPVKPASRGKTPEWRGQAKDNKRTDEHRQKTHEYQAGKQAEEHRDNQHDREPRGSKDGLTPNRSFAPGVQVRSSFRRLSTSV
jgi:hypothetical protein